MSKRYFTYHSQTRVKETHNNNNKKTETISMVKDKDNGFTFFHLPCKLEGDLQPLSLPASSSFSLASKQTPLLL